MSNCLKSLFFAGLLVFKASFAYAAGTEFSVTVAASGSGSGSVSDAGGHISCTSTSGTASGTCHSGPAYKSSFTVTLTATPSAGSSFSSWSGCTSVSGNICYVNGDPDDDKHVTVTFTEGDGTEDNISQNMQNRANELANNQTELFGFLQGDRGGFFNADGSEGTGYFHAGSMEDGMFWFDVKGSWSSDSGTDTAYGLGTLGSHFEVNENLLLGGMVQADLAQSKDTSSTARSRGWLVGPYVVARHPEHEIYFEGTALYGQTYNWIKPTNTYEDRFTTDRWLVRGAVTGEIALETLSLFPSLSLTHVSDAQRAYTDSLSNQISAQSISLTQGKIGLDFNKPFQLEGKHVALIGGVSGIWSRSYVSSGATVGTSPNFDGARGKVHAGLNFKDDTGLSSTFSAYYDGIGANNYQAIGVSFGLKKEF